MDSSEEDCGLMETQFVKPCVTSIDGLVAKLPCNRLSVSSSSSDLLSRVCFTRYWSPNRHFKSWALKMEALHKPTWEKAGILKAIKASTYEIRKNPSLILSLVEKWCPETKSFIFPWGEATITLEDVMVLLEFSVLGSSVFAPLESLEMRDSVEEMERVMEEGMRKFSRMSQKQWISCFRNRDDSVLEHEAFLALWLSYFVFQEMSRSCVSSNVFPIAVRLARGEKIALAPAVLASLYRDLSQIQACARDKWSTRDLNLTSLFKLVQVWAWERFSDIRPEAKPLWKDEPRIARWSCRNLSYERLSFDGFEWRPYAKDLENWRLPRFYLDEAKWLSVDKSLDDEFISFARCLRVSKLVGIGSVEDYYPHRVARQFGFAQDLPGLVTDHSFFTEKEAWDDYNKSLDGLKLYMPSRLATASVTARYQDWWLKSVSEFLNSQESSETFSVRNTAGDDDDDDDASLKILPLSQVLEKLGEGFPAKLKRCRKSLTARNMRWEIKKGKFGDCGGSDSREVPLSDMFEMDLVKSTTSKQLRNKRARGDCYDGSGSVGKRSRKFQVVDSEDSEPCEKLASITIEQIGKEDEDETTSKTQKRMQVCDDDEIDVNGSNAEKKTETTKVESRLHDDERWKQRKLAIEELASNLEARMTKVEKTLAMIKKWKTSRNQVQSSVYA